MKAPDGLNDTHRGTLHEHGTRTETDERQRDAGNGHEPDAHADLLEHLEGPHADYAHRGKLQEQRIAPMGDANSRKNQDGKQSQENDGTDKTELLGEEGEDEIRVRLGKKSGTRLGGMTDPLTEEPARPHRD